MNLAIDYNMLAAAIAASNTNHAINKAATATAARSEDLAANLMSALEGATLSGINASKQGLLVASIVKAAMPLQGLSSAIFNAVAVRVVTMGNRTQLFNTFNRALARECKKRGYKSRLTFGVPKVKRGEDPILVETWKQQAEKPAYVSQAFGLVAQLSSGKISLEDFQSKVQALVEAPKKAEARKARKTRAK